MNIVTSEMVAQALESVLADAACKVPADVLAGLVTAREAEQNPRGASALDMLLQNDCLAAAEGLPICQDTGTVRLELECGPDVCVPGGVFSGVDAVVAKIYTEQGFRASVVKDALFDRTNTKTNTPAFCRVTFTEEPGARIHVMLKGGGSDNASYLTMLPPSAGREGIIREVVARVQAKAANACPPLVVGVGVGGTFDSVASLAFAGLMREVGAPAQSEEAAALEAELTAAIAATGIGAGAQGGAATALAVHVETAPCHIAALPLAVELGCSALRRRTVELFAEGEAVEEEPASFVPASAAPIASGADPVALTLPLDPAVLATLQPGQACTLTGEMYTLRDAGHARLCAELDEAGTDTPLPYGLAGATIFYAGPTPPSPVRPEQPFGAVGPTTSSRMDAWAPRLYAAGVRATVGKGTRDASVAEACRANGCVYFTAIGGAAALLASCVESAETVAFGDLGTEALRRLVVKDFPVTVAISAAGDVDNPAAVSRQASERQA